MRCTDYWWLTSFPCADKFLTGYGGHIMVMGTAVRAV
jgi:hypothetical protein